MSTDKSKILDQIKEIKNRLHLLNTVEMDEAVNQPGQSYYAQVMEDIEINEALLKKLEDALKKNDK